VAQKKQGSRVPAAVGALPVVGGIVKTADQQAQWMQELIEQQARLVGQLPTTLKTLNDSIEKFNQTVNRLERTANRIESTTGVLTGPLATVAATLDPARLAELPDVLDSLRREAAPALRAATDTQRQVALLQATVERIIAIISELPGAGFVKRMTAGAPRADEPAAETVSDEP
jgi:ABC-type transporter Mla subunit MlaD